MPSSACRRGLAAPCSGVRVGGGSNRRSGGKVEIPPRLRDFQGAVGTVGNRFVVLHGLHGPVFSTALRRFLCARGKSLAARLVAAHYVGTIPDGHVSVEMFVD